MDPVTVGAFLVAIASGAGDALGGQLWDGLVSLVRRVRHGSEKQAPHELPAALSGEAELTALQAAPADQGQAVALAKVLLARAEADPAFDRELRAWWEQAAPVREQTGNVANSITGGTFSGPVLQGRDFSGLTFGAAPAAPPAAAPARAERPDAS